MSKKHFIAMAREFARIENIECRRQAAEAFAVIAKQVNPAFDRARFFAACGL